MSKVLPHPFIKWAGGKSKMLGHIISAMPEKINTYYEPFLGGGAVFFELKRRNAFRKAVLSDMNPELMNAYGSIKTDVNGLISELSKNSYSYNKESYLKIRSLQIETLSVVERAARFIYLNKTCFNGLYRVNQKGEFNVPFGKYTNPQICDSENLLAVSKSLKKVKLLQKNFDLVVKEAKVGDVIYFDPPYYPLSETSNFVSYTNSGFSLANQSQLSIVFSNLSNKGVTVILSNSWCPTTLQLYRDHEIVELTASRNIGGPADYRKSVKEILVVTNIEKLEGFV